MFDYLAKTRCARRLLNRFKKSEHGVAAIEFAMIAFPFLILLAAIFEIALIFFTQSALDAGVNRAARMIRTGQVQANGISAAQFKQIVCQDLTKYLNCDANLSVDVRSFDAFTTVVVPDPVGPDGELTGNNDYSPGDSLQVVVARAFYVWNLTLPDHITGLANMTGGRRVIATGAAFRNEPF